MEIEKNNNDEYRNMKKIRWSKTSTIKENGKTKCGKEKRETERHEERGERREKSDRKRGNVEGTKTSRATVLKAAQYTSWGCLNRRERGRGGWRRLHREGRVAPATWGGEGLRRRHGSHLGRDEKTSGGWGAGRLSPKELSTIYDSIFSVTGLLLMGV